MSNETSGLDALKALRDAAFRLAGDKKGFILQTDVDAAITALTARCAQAEHEAGCVEETQSEAQGPYYYAEAVGSVLRAGGVVVFVGSAKGREVAALANAAYLAGYESGRIDAARKSAPCRSYKGIAFSLCLICGREKMAH